jgi:hypothetical protein
VTLTEREEGRLQFPIVTSADRFDEQVNRGRLLHVEAAPRQLIEAIQPYKTKPAAPKMAILYLVNELDNADKHRALTVVGLNTAVVQRNWPPHLSSVPFQPNGSRPTEPGSEIGRYVFPAPVSEQDAPVEFEWGFAIRAVHYFPWSDIRHVLRTYIKATTDWISVISEKLA